MCVCTEEFDALAHGGDAAGECQIVWLGKSCSVACFQRHRVSTVLAAVLSIYFSKVVASGQRFLLASEQFVCCWCMFCFAEGDLMSPSRMAIFPEFRDKMAVLLAEAEDSGNEGDGPTLAAVGTSAHNRASPEKEPAQAKIGLPGFLRKKDKPVAKEREKEKEKKEEKTKKSEGKHRNASSSSG